jgi:hypothetical protein
MLMNQGERDHFFVEHVTSDFGISYSMHVRIHVLFVAPLVMGIAQKNPTKVESPFELNVTSVDMPFSIGNATTITSRT